MTRIADKPRIHSSTIQQQPAVTQAEARPSSQPVQTGVAGVAQELPPSTGNTRLPAQTDAKSLGQNKGLLSYVNARISVEQQQGGDVSTRFASALRQRGAEVTALKLEGGALDVTFKSMADFDKARALFTSDRYGSISFEGARVQWRTGELPPGA